MKNKKIEKKVIYEGLGFPIILHNAPMIKIRGIWTLDIDFNVFQKAVLLALAHHPADLTGSQIRFIRTWSGLTQSEFSKIFGVTHPAIGKWEKAENKSTKMSIALQRDLRLWLLDQLLVRDDDFRKAFKVVHTIIYKNKAIPLELDIPIDLVAV